MNPASKRISPGVLACATIAIALGWTTMCAPAADAQGIHGNWTKLHDVPAPPAPPPPSPPHSIEVPPVRTSLGFIHDPTRDRVVVFGGAGAANYNDVWTLSLVPGSEWTKLTPVGVPPANRYGASVIYDPVGDRMIVFGGAGAATYNDVWQLNFSGTPTWTQLTPIGTPPSPRQDVACIYDPIGNRIVFFGGYAPGGGDFNNQAYSLSLTGTPAWTTMAPTGTPPSGRNVMVFAYDSMRHRMLLYGGFNGVGYLGDTWALNLAGAGSYTSIAAASPPPARREAYGSYDSQRDVLTIFGGFNGGYLGDSWELTLAGSPAWTQIFPSGARPTSRAGGRAIFDASRSQLVMYAGYDGNWQNAVWLRSLGASPAWSIHHPGTSPVPTGAATLPATDGVSPGRSSFGMVLDSARDRMLVFGGLPAKRNDVYSMPLSANSVWSYLSSSTPAPSPRLGCGAIYDAAGDRLVIYGGQDGTDRRSDVWALSLAGLTSWSNLSPVGPAPAPRQDAATVYDPVGQRMIVFGGFAPVLGGYSNDVWTFSLTGSPAWTQLAPAGTPPSVRASMMYAWDSIRNRLLVYGGFNGTSHLSDTWELNLAGSGTWTQVVTANFPPARREGYAAFDAARDRFVIYAGYSGSERGDSWELTRSGTPDWTEVFPTGTAPANRHGGGALYDPPRQRFVIYGGFNGTYPRDIMARSLNATPAWSLLHLGAPRISARRDYVMTYRPLANEIYLFGGERPGSIDTDETYVMALGVSPLEWRRVEPGTPKPIARHGHRAVWDPVRDRMLVFGGFYMVGFDGTYGNDLWAFVPSPTPHWEAVATTGSPPQGRMLGGLGYDPVGDRLILYGGHAGSPTPYLLDPYELPLSGPSALQWAPLATTGTAPSPRWLYGTQYDPLRHRMISAGGVTPGGRTNEVWTLSLSGTPNWSSPSISGTPMSARSDHAMVYDQVSDRMVVFGGFDNSVMLNDAVAINLSGSPSWLGLSPTGGPPGVRDIIDGIYDPVAGRMIVYGGWNNTDYLNDTWALEWATTPTPVLVSLVRASADVDRVELVWEVTGDLVSEAKVEKRREGYPEWITLGTAAVGGSGRLRFEDRGVLPGDRNYYRLRIFSSGETSWSQEVPVDVPTGYSLELAGAKPNPSSGDRLNVEFTLPSRTAGRLELFDVAGRIVESRGLESFAPGRNRIAFGAGRAIEPGLYLIRLSAGSRTLTSKALVVR